MSESESRWHLGAMVTKITAGAYGDRFMLMGRSVNLRVSATKGQNL
ncbi:MULTISPECIES: hypothetical protein [Planktothricoides]|uniref:Uncharacterized protein n=2 Tax=Planktothricoides raciborskii TaxID=132608 RepID=A0AAU8JD36_9CYAN|nr:MULTISPECIES: hypothetical protein [Planktothricoides]MBD2545841.1 hypothetical protein [Planktothricoides raciborskii FACHB-1370]MBD2584099.1 hypothetical protein [Planktothricoides raciborskii FACHB-1261]